VDLSSYIGHLARETYAAGDTIFSKGDAGTSMYIVVEGEVDVAYDDQRSVRLGAGESLGEMSLIDQGPRSATVTAVTDVALAPINQGMFFVLVNDTPYFALEVMRSLSNRLRRANQMPAATE
jgi:CRP-like cAMP-binding protein